MDNNNGPILLKKENNGFLLIAIIIFSIILLYNFIITNQNVNNSKEDESIYELKDFIGEHVPGYDVIKLLNLICKTNSQETTNIIRINPNFTSKNNKKITGQNNYEPEYIKESLIPEIDYNKKYIVQMDSYGRLIIADESTLSYGELQDYNSAIERYLGNEVIGTEVKELIGYIKDHNKNQHKNNTENYIRLLIHLDKNYTKNEKSYYLLTGISPNIINSEEYLSEYIDAIKDEEYYYIKIDEYNPNGTVYVIVISDVINKFRY